MHIKNTVVEYLADAAIRYGDKPAYVSPGEVLSFAELNCKARSIGCYLSRIVQPNSPVAILMDKSVRHINAIFGAVYAGCFYIPLDYKMPADRLQNILNTLQPSVIICEKKTERAIKAQPGINNVLFYEDIVNTPEDGEKLEKIAEGVIDTDLLYVIFTSGSTGSPKGVTISQRSVIRYMNHMADVFGFCEEDVWANQAPLYFDMAVCDIFQPIFTGSTTHLLSKSCFLFPKMMVDYLNENKVTVFQWTPSAMMNLSNSGIMEEDPPRFLRWVLFGAEVLPTKQLNRWRRALSPDVRFCNAYGPTEATDTATYYFIEREFADDEVLPLGQAMPNMRIYLLDDENQEVKDGEPGEICITGNSLSFGYYNDPERTKAAFVQNPLNTHYEEKMYRTGDLAYRNEHGELVYIGRKDFQIKLHGYRIELGEIEHAASVAEGAESVCCIFDKVKEQILCLYTGSVSEGEMLSWIKSKVPVYMVPAVIKHLDDLPRTPNGKIDRVFLKKTYTEE